MKLRPIEIVYITGVFTIVGALIGGLVVPSDSELILDPVKCVDLPPCAYCGIDFSNRSALKRISNPGCIIIIE